MPLALRRVLRRRSLIVLGTSFGLSLIFCGNPTLKTEGTITGDETGDNMLNFRIGQLALPYSKHNRGVVTEANSDSPAFTHLSPALNRLTLA